MRPGYLTTATTWRAYQPHLPARLRLPDDELPTESTWDWEGLEVHLDRYERSGAAATVVVLHGAGGYGRLLAPYGRLLARGGADVVLPDLPGYGLTACPGRRMTYDLWVACVRDLLQAESARTGRPVLVLGASMGGMLGLHAAMAAPPGTVAGLAATTLMDPRSAQVRRGAGRFPVPAGLLRVGLLDRLPVPVPLLAPVERMSSAAAVNRLCRRDPQGGGGRVPLGFLRTWLTHTPATELEDFDRCPVLLTHPLADRWTPPDWSRQVLDRLPVPTRFVGLEGCEHLPLEEPGLSVLTEVLVEWAGLRPGPPPR